MLRIISLSLVLSLALSSAVLASTWQVHGVRADDTLNVRANPGVGAAIVTRLSHQASGIKLTGQKRKIGSTVWVEITTQGKKGWVSHRYLRATPAPVANNTAANRPTPRPATPRPAPRPAAANNARAAPAVATRPQAKVVGVKANDTLSMRAGAGVGNALVAKIPPNATVNLTNARKVVGTTPWVRVNYAGKTGWVSQRYLRNIKPTRANVSSQPEKRLNQPVNVAQAEKPKPIKKAIVTQKQSGMWILECGSAQPYWKVEVLPEWMKIYTPKFESGVPITYKRQQHSKWHRAALKTEVGGRRGTLGLDLTLNFTKQCHSSLVNRKVTFSAKAQLNGDNYYGCCRAYQVK